MTAFYIHYPFCKSKCPYCDFNSHVRDKIDYQAMTQSYFREIEYFSSNCYNKKITSIFFGGGTPSLMPVELVDDIINYISQKFFIDECCEISLEANPTSSEGKKFQNFKEIGVNRLSIGVQALNDDDLRFLGREHSAKEAMKVIEMAQKIYNNFSFDLIYARPNQTPETWHEELIRALQFQSKHMSLYQLTIEKGTKFYSKFRNKEFDLPDENTASNLYQITNQIMAENGFRNYEISNYAKKNYECRHNLSYWQSDDYIGIGAGAHSRVVFNDLRRYAIQITSEPAKWIFDNLNKNSAIQKISKIEKIEMIEEIVMMGLRLEDGIRNEVFMKYFNQKIFELFDYKKLEFLTKNELLFIDDNCIKIPSKSLILANSIIEKVCLAIIE